jgi:hypothetical protein
MLLRTLVTLVNLGTIAVALGILLVYPQYAGIAFYVLLGWMLGTLVLAYGPYANRQIGARPVTGAPGPSGSPLASVPSGHDVGFCIYCAAPLPVGAPICPACGHRVSPG